MKKLLIISSWAPPMIGGPQNLYNIFSQFPNDSYSIITSYNSIVNSLHSRIKGSWLPCKYYYFDTADHSYVSQQNIQTTKGHNFNFKRRLHGLLNKIPLVNTAVNYYLIPIKLILQFTSRTISIVKRKNIKILFGISDSGAALITTFLTYLVTKIPYVLYFFDIYKENNLSGIYKILSKLFEKSLIQKSSLTILTNEKTEEFFKNKYGKNLKTAIVYNSTFTENYKKIKHSYNPQPPYKIIFTGNVYWPQEQSLLNLIEAINLIHDIAIELHLYIPILTDTIKQKTAYKKNIVINSASPSEMPIIQSNADLLFLPLSWNTKSPDIIATATPGKFTDYLASGRPMLVHAPDYAYVSQYTKEYRLGLVVDKNDAQLLADTIRDFLKDPSIGQQYIDNALKIFYQNHDARKNAKKLIKLLKMV